MQQRMTGGLVAPDDAVAKNFSLVPAVNGRWYQAQIGLGNRFSLVPFPNRDGRLVMITGVRLHLFDRALKLLKAPPERQAIAKAIQQGDSAELNDAMRKARVIGAIHRTSKEWLQHAQGEYLSTVPLIEIVKIGDSSQFRTRRIRPSRCQGSARCC